MAQPDSNRFCDQCGANLDEVAPSCGGRGEILIGRDDECAVHIPWGQVQVSRKHARVILQGDNLFIEDLGTANKTYVNGRLCQGPTAFSLRDEVRFGSYVLNTADLQAALERSQPASQPSPPLPATPAPGPKPAPVAVDPRPAASPEARGDEVPFEPKPLAVRPLAPNSMQSARGPRLAPGKNRSPAGVVLLGIFTLGIYIFFWYWVTLDEIRPWRDHQGWSGPMLLLMFVPIVNLVMLALPFVLAGYVGDLFRRQGRPAPISGPYGLICLIPFVGIIFFAMVQNALNDFWAQEAAAQ